MKKLSVILFSFFLMTTAHAQYGASKFNDVTFIGKNGYCKANAFNPVTCLPTIPATDITGLPPSATIDTTNATNINSGTFGLARLPIIPASQTSGLQPLISASGILKANGSSPLTVAIPGTDYLLPTGSGAGLIGLTNAQISAALGFIPANEKALFTRSLTSFGAVGDGVTDDTSKVALALRSGFPISCDGAYKLTSEIIIDANSINGLALFGAGATRCKFVQATSTAGITTITQIPNNYDSPQILFKDFSFVPLIPNINQGLKISAIGGSGATMPSVSIINVHSRPSSFSNYAKNPFIFDNVRISKISEVTCAGSFASGYVPGSNCVSFTGDSQPVEVEFSNVKCYYFDTCVNLTGTYQGVTLSDSSCVACRVGMAITATDNNGVLVRSINNQWNVTDFGVQAINVTDIQSTGGLTYLNNLGGSLTNNPACVSQTMTANVTAYPMTTNLHCDGANRSSVSAQNGYPTSPLGNKAAVFYDGPASGSNLTNGIVDNLQCSGLNYCVILGAKTNKVYIGAITSNSIINSEIFNAGINNVRASTVAIP